jgi:hypothetical protein
MGKDRGTTSLAGRVGGWVGYKGKEGRPFLGKQAVKDHYELILGPFCDFSQFLTFWPILVDFST